MYTVKSMRKLLEDTIDDCMLVIVGASGDLTARKLVPELYNLYVRKRLPEKFCIQCVSRSKYTSEEFRDQLLKKAKEKISFDPDLDQWKAFAEMLFYTPLDLSLIHI